VFNTTILKMMKKFKSVFLPLIALSFFISSGQAHASTKPLALVWKGPGACEPDCVAGAAHMAKLAGFQVQYVKPGITDFSVFDNAKLWMQPGGVSVTAADAMGPSLLNRIREFVSDGGGYVGFCAGAFLTTNDIGTSGVTGLGIVPGVSDVYVQEGSEHHVFKIALQTGSRYMYYAGGPNFSISDSDLEAVQGQVIGRYPDGTIAGVEVHYGKGKVAVIGTHPEAGFLWKLINRQIDPDGLDYDFAVGMIKYATSP
jgi:glutamine amidotransferase-like uncharacterized protein